VKFYGYVNRWKSWMSKIGQLIPRVNRSGIIIYICLEFG
jgi:hypothetical protein